MRAGHSTSCMTSSACGRRFRILNVVDDVTRECLAAIPDTSISGPACGMGAFGAHRVTR